MKSLTIILAVLVPALWHCTDAPVPDSTSDSPALAGLGSLVIGDEGMPPDTGQLIARRVWAGDDVNSLGQTTPDGRYLTFVDWSSEGDGNVGVRDLRTGEVRHITNRQARDPMGAYADLIAVSRDGKRVAYQWYPGAWVMELHVVDLDGSNRKILLRDKEITGAAPRDWTPDGSQILAVVERKGGGSQLVLVSVEDGSQRLLKPLERATYNARLSADGQFVVYDQPSKGVANKRDIFIFPVDGGDAGLLVQHPADDYVLGWVPNSDYVMFASDRTGTLGAYVQRVINGSATGPPELIRPDLWRAWPMGFAADGSFFYGVSVSTRTISLAPIDLETGSLAGDPTSIDPRNIGNLSRPSWSADGRYLSYLNGEFRAGPRIMIRSFETGETRAFDPRLPTAYPPRWSPDGRHLLLLARSESDHRSIYRIDVQTGEVRELRALEGAIFKAAWGPDGGTIYYKVDFERQSQLVALEVESGVERVVRSETQPSWITIYWNVSPDGQWIGYWQRDRVEEPGSRVLRLMLIPTSGTEEPRELTRVDWSGQGLFPVEGAWWTDGGRSLLYAKGTGEGENLEVEFWKVPVDGGEPVLTNLALDGWTAGRPQFSPDGRMVAYETGESAREVWVMKNYLPDK